jgi:PAS domain S-box-containing protein
LRAEIAERKQAEEEIRFQAHLLDAVGQAVIATDLEGCITYWNPSAQDLYGWSVEEMIGRSVMEIIPSETQLERAEEIMSELRAGRSWSGEFEVKRKDGTSFPVIITHTPVHDERGNLVGIIGISTDITKRKGIEEALRQSERLYRTVVEQAEESIFLVDAETKRILEANTTLNQSLNYTAEELRQMTLYDIVAHDRESIDRNARRVMEEGRLFVGERSYRRKDGSLVDVEVNVSTTSHKERETLCIVAHDVTEYKQTEESLRRSLGMLLALREAGQVLGSTLESEEVVSRLLEIMRRVSNLTTTVISVLGEDGRARIWRSVGLEGLWERARFARQALDARRAVLETEEHQLFLLQHPGSETARLVGLYLPLRTRERVIGVLEAYGSEALAESDTVEVLASLASQAASALENARLYGELGEREHRLQDLVGRLLGAQEEEQRRVAYEVHDGLAQVAAAAHQHLQAFARRHPPSGERSRRDLERVLRLVRQTVSESRRIIGNLRPTTLDDLGLVATISMEVERLREEDYEIEYKEELGDERLPATVEIALFRVVQEALTNIQKHAHTRRVRIELRRQEEEVHLEVQDSGTGFKPTVASAGSGPGERVGLAGMRERVGMLGGKFKIHSRPGVGTSVIVEVPLPATNVEASISASIT